MNTSSSHLDDFGVIIACCFQDYLLAKGACASVRHFLGDVPLCLLVDGTFSTESLEKAYNATVINHKTIKNDVLRERSFGWGTTRLIAFWESPWKHFLILDADTNIWGNVLKFADFENFDVIMDEPNYNYPDEEIIEYFFEIEEVEKHFPDFDWRSHRTQYCCPGVYFASRDIFSLEEYMEVLDFIDRYPHIFKYGDMGFLNFMLWRASDAGKIRVGNADFQVLAPNYEQKDLEKRFVMTKTGPLVQNDDAAIIHWCGYKPLMSTSRTYAEPMSFSRRKCLEAEIGWTGLPADVLLQWEDFYSTFIKYKNKARKKIGKLLG